jgi:hypothetical protein
VSGGNLGTHLDRPYAQQSATREAAARYLIRSGNADLVDVLGLTEPDHQPGNRPDCYLCGRPRQRETSGGWKPCKRQLCAGGAW